MVDMYQYNGFRDERVAMKAEHYKHFELWTIENGKLPDFQIHTIALMHNLDHSHILFVGIFKEKEEEETKVAKIIELWSTK